MKILKRPKHTKPTTATAYMKNEGPFTFAGHVDGTDFYVSGKRLLEVHPTIDFGPPYVGWVQSPLNACADAESVAASKWWTDDCLEFVKIFAALHQ